MLNIDRSVNIDASTQQFFDVEISLGVTAARYVRVSEFVHQRKLRAARDQRVEVHLLHDTIAVVHRSTRNDLKAFEKLCCFASPVGLDNPNDDVDAIFPLRLCGLKHLIGLADARCRADEYL